MNKFTDALRIAIEPLRFLIDKNSRRIADNVARIDKLEPKAAQSDMAQSNPDAPDFIKNCIAYDRRKRTVLFEGEVSTPNYGGGLYVSDEYPASIKLGGLYSVELKTPSGKAYSLVGRSVEDVEYGGNWIRIPVGFSDDSFTLDHIKAEADRMLFYGFISSSEPAHVTVSEVEDTADFKAVPKHLMSDLPVASMDGVGAVRIDGTTLDDTWGYNPVYITTWGALYVEDQIQQNKAIVVMPSAPTSSDVGKITRVQSDGTWGLEAIPSAEEASF